MYIGKFDGGTIRVWFNNRETRVELDTRFIKETLIGVLDALILLLKEGRQSCAILYNNVGIVHIIFTNNETLLMEQYEMVPFISFIDEGYFEIATRLISTIDIHIDSCLLDNGLINEDDKRQILHKANEIRYYLGEYNIGHYNNRMEGDECYF